MSVCVCPRARGFFRFPPSNVLLCDSSNSDQARACLLHCAFKSVVLSELSIET